MIERCMLYQEHANYWEYQSGYAPSSAELCSVAVNLQTFSWYWPSFVAGLHIQLFSLSEAKSLPLSSLLHVSRSLHL
jgi:hypothetical protein